jgi:cytidylate kinase
MIGILVQAYRSSLRKLSPVIVTISNEYGSGAVAIAQRAAEELGYEFVDRQLPVVVAKRLSISPEEVDAGEDASRTLGERLMTSLELATPELSVSAVAAPFDEELLAAVRDAVREYAARGNVVIVGRGAGAILGERGDVLRVFMHAPRDWRVTHIVEATQADRKTAESEIDRIDRARADYLRQHYKLEFGDPRKHDLCIDTSRFESQRCVELIVTAVRARSA